MGAKLTFRSTSIELSRFANLGGTLARSRGEDILVTDAGVRRVFNRKIPTRRITAEFKLLNPNDRRLLEQFFEETVKGRKELFTFETETSAADLLQVGATVGGNLVVVGTPLSPSCWFPSGGFIKVGQWVVQDSHIFTNVRFEMPSLTFIDEAPNNSSTLLSMVQELSP